MAGSLFVYFHHLLFNNIICYFVVGMSICSNVLCFLWLLVLSTMTVRYHLSLDIRESGDSSRRKTYLPADKQFLVTKKGDYISLMFYT